MEIENLEAANKAVKRLKQVQCFLDVATTERQKLDDAGGKYPIIDLKVDNVYIETDDAQLAKEILYIIIGKYSTEKKELIAQIKSY